MSTHDTVETLKENVDAVTEPFFFETPDGARLFGVWRDVRKRDAGANAQRVWVICPPFAEEDKSARRTLAELCLKLRARGEASLLFSFRGTGDSEGDFADCTLQSWRSDVLAACREAMRRAPDADLCLLGVRLGASLAAQVAEETNASQLVLVEPLLNGRSYLAAMGQRKKLRAMMTSEHGDKAQNGAASDGTASDGTAKSATATDETSRGVAEKVDVASPEISVNVEDLDGWPLAPALRDEMNALDLQSQIPSLSPRMITHVLQVGPRAQMAPPLERFARALNASPQAVVMRPFWNLLDYARADALFDAVLNLEPTSES